MKLLHHHHEHGCTCSECSGADAPREKISIRTHDGAIITAYSCTSEKDYDDLKNSILPLIAEIQTWFIENKYLIGHIKGFIEKDGKRFIFSTVGKDITTAENAVDESGEATINLVSIVYGTNNEALKEKWTEICTTLER